MVVKAMNEKVPTRGGRNTYSVKTGKLLGVDNRQMGTYNRGGDTESDSVLWQRKHVGSNHHIFKRVTRMQAG